MSAILDAALSYAARGWPVFPVGSRGDLKRPRIKDWPNAASTDPAQLEDWWTRWPDSGPWEVALQVIKEMAAPLNLAGRRKTDDRERLRMPTCSSSTRESDRA